MKEVLLQVKRYQIAVHATEKLIVKGRVSQCVKLHYHLTVRNCQATPNFSNNHLDQSEAINNKARLSTRKKKDYNSLKTQIMVKIF